MCYVVVIQAARGKRSLETAASVYKYTCLGDLVCGKACVYGVVVNMSLPKRTRGSDYSVRGQLLS